MRRTVALAVLVASVALAGCLSASSSGLPSGQEVALEEEGFASPGAALVGFHARFVCGQVDCRDTSDYGEGHEVFAVYANGRAVVLRVGYVEGNGSVDLGHWLDRGPGDRRSWVLPLLEPLASPENPAWAPNRTVRLAEPPSIGTVLPGAYDRLVAALSDNWTEGAAAQWPCAECDLLGTYAKVEPSGDLSVVHAPNPRGDFAPVVEAFREARATYDAGNLREEYTLSVVQAEGAEGALRLDEAEVRREAPVLAEALDAALAGGAGSVSADEAPATAAFDLLEAEAREAGHKSFHAPPVNSTVVWQGEALQVHLIVV